MPIINMTEPTVIDSTNSQLVDVKETKVKFYNAIDESVQLHILNARFSLAIIFYGYVKFADESIPATNKYFIAVDNNKGINPTWGVGLSQDNNLAATHVFCQSQISSLLYAIKATDPHEIAYVHIKGSFLAGCSSGMFYSGITDSLIKKYESLIKDKTFINDLGNDRNALGFIKVADAYTIQTATAQLADDEGQPSDNMQIFLRANGAQQPALLYSKGTAEFQQLAQPAFASSNTQRLFAEYKSDQPTPYVAGVAVPTVTPATTQFETINENTPRLG